MNRGCPRRRLALPFPDDVLEEIFARLPAKQALRLHGLSRAWTATLSSDDFVERHLRAANGRPKILCLRDDDDNNGTAAQVHASSLDGPGGATFMGAPRSLTPGCFPHLASDVWPDEDDPPHLYRRAPDLATQQCRGLVILHALQAGAFYVCNPSTGQMVTLPEGRITTGHWPTQGSPPRDEASRYASLGLGYDSRTRKHEVVRVHYHGRDGAVPRRAGCEVYEIGSSRCEWRPAATGEKPTCWVDPGSRSVFAQGHLYWLAHRKSYPPGTRDYRREDLVILSFSIIDETLGTLPPPPGMGGVEPWSMWDIDLTELSGRLCLFRPYLSVDHCDLWLLQSGLSGETARWDLHCRIDLAGGVPPELNKIMGARSVTSFNSLAPLAIIDNGRRILLTEHSYPNQICAYTPDTGHIESLIDTSNMTMVHQAAVYMESVASPGCLQPSDQDIVTITSPSTQALWVVLRLLPKHTRGKLMCVCRSWHRMIERHSRIYPSV